ncbi:MAG TPA: HEAT repeat domain-containing protein [bacterium]|nr:HEAT repeat domain-containing protein [bacterium]
MSPIVGLQPFIMSMQSPRVQPVAQISVSEVMQAIRVSSNHTVIIDMLHLNAEPSPVALSWLQGIAQTRGFAIHLLRKGNEEVFTPKALPLPEIEIPQTLARAFLSDLVSIQDSDPSGKAIVETYGQTAIEALFFLANRFSESLPLLPADEPVPTDLMRPLLENIFTLLQYDPMGKRVAETYQKRCVEPLFFLMDRLPEALVPALHALGRIGEPRAVDKIVSFLRHEAPSVREAAVRALHPPRSPGPLEDLWRIAFDGAEDSRVRREAAVSLGLLGDRGKIPGLLALLDNEEMLDRLAAVRALGWYAVPVSRSRGDERERWASLLRESVVPALEERTKDPSHMVSTQARWSLRKLTEAL